MTVVELFAGPGGFSLGAVRAGVTDLVGFEWDADACATAEAAGHKRIQADVSMVDVREWAHAEGEIGSPPCQSYSPAGKQKGKLDRPRIEAHVARVKAAGRWLHYSREGWHDDRSPLVLEPLRFALGILPEWIALEQVPAVLPLWQAMADVLRDHGYHADTGVLSAEQYGVPQTRKRAFLIAHYCEGLWHDNAAGVVHACDLDVSLPAPTHRKYRKGVAQAEGDPALLPWVSMAQALGWDAHARVGFGRRADAGEIVEIDGEQYRARDFREASEPAFGLTEKVRSWSQHGEGYGGLGGRAARHDVRRLGEDEAHARYGNRAGNDGPVVSTGNNQYTVGPGQRGEPGERDWRSMSKPYERDVTDPAPVVDGNAAGAWAVHAPGDRRAAISEKRAVRVSVREAAVLQTFPPGYPWQGSKTAQYRQVGDAVPVVLAEVVVRAALGLPQMFR